MTCRAQVGILTHFDFALRTVENAMPKRRLADVLEIDCPGCVAAEIEWPALITVEVEYDPGCRDYGPAREWVATGCPHVEGDPYGTYDREINDALDSHAADMAERDAADREEHEAHKGEDFGC